MTETAPLSRSRMITIGRVITETPDAVSLVLTVDADDRDDFAYQSGQFLTFRIPSEQTGSVSRCYSIASAPTVDTEIKVTVKRTPAGYGSNWLCDNAAAGMQLQVLPPAGVFVPASLVGDFLLFAGGSGITPIMSILKSALAEGTGSVTLIYANRDERSVIFADELRALSARYPQRLLVHHLLESVSGLPTRDLLQLLARSYTGYEAFTCGPAPFMDAVTDALKALDVPRERRHTEAFLSLSGDSFADIPIPLPPADAHVESFTARVRFNGTDHELAWPVTTPLIDVMIDNGINAPYSCREGECGSCTARVTSGRVTMQHNEVLDPQDVEDGYILGCQALPDGTDVDVEF